MIVSDFSMPALSNKPSAPKFVKSDYISKTDVSEEKKVVKRSKTPALNNSRPSIQSMNNYKSKGIDCRIEPCLEEDESV